MAHLCLRLTVSFAAPQLCSAQPFLLSHCLAGLDYAFPEAAKLGGFISAATQSAKRALFCWNASGRGAQDADDEQADGIVQVGTSSAPMPVWVPVRVHKAWTGADDVKWVKLIYDFTLTRPGAFVKQVAQPKVLRLRDLHRDWDRGRTACQCVWEGSVLCQ